jgi:hypothetical protein
MAVAPSRADEPVSPVGVSYRLPDDPAVRERALRAGGWLTRHLVTVTAPGGVGPVRVVAWKDPTLAPDDPGLLAGYLITDTLWAAEALRPIEAATSRSIVEGLERLGWARNGLHEVLFRPVGVLLVRPDDEDWMHGASLGHARIGGGPNRVDLRVFRQRRDDAYDVGHPLLFAEHAVFRALDDAWKGRPDDARRRLLAAIADSRSTDPSDSIFWDPEARVLVDHVTLDDWKALREGTRPAIWHYSFKLGTLLHAIRLLGLEGDVPAATLAGMRDRQWSSQQEDGVIPHFVEVRRDGTASSAPGGTGEATAIAILSETVVPRGAR